MVNLTIDGVQISVPSTYTVLEAAKSAGIKIPTLCYLKGVNEVGACRVCLVEIEKARALAAACVMPVSEGMVVHTNSAKVRATRKSTLELILSDHNRDCLQCIRNQNCELQSLADQYSIRNITFTGEKSPSKYDDKSYSIVRDGSKCIKCGRCVSACAKQGIGVLSFLNRGFSTGIGPAYDVSMADAPCIFCGQCIIACPVGALHEKEETEKVWDAIHDPNKHVVMMLSRNLQKILPLLFTVIFALLVVVVVYYGSIPERYTLSPGVVSNVDIAATRSVEDTFETEKRAKESMVVLELSSFQLLTMKKSADVAVVTNITPNHLDVHKDYQEYIDAKKNIFVSQSFSGRLVLNGENEITSSMAADARGKVSYFSWDQHKPLNNTVSGLFDHAFVKDEILMYMSAGHEQKIVPMNDIVIPGNHNVENYLAAACAVMPFVTIYNIASVAKSFGGVEHRIELVRNVDGVRYFNSSIDTSPNRTINTMNALAGRGEHGVLIAGGADKKCDYTGLGKAILSVCSRIILCGSNASLVRDILAHECADDTYTVIEAADYTEALQKAKELAVPGEIVILSPTGTSYDKFRHFEERGNLFKKLVAEL